MLYSILASSFLAIALANPIVSRAAPSVSIKNGTIVGSSDGTVDSFKGIPFAEPPVGDLRLKAPRPLSKGYGTLQATRTPRSCPQQSLDTNDGIIQGLPTDVLARLLNTPFFQKVSNAGEDCLTLNVQRPSTATSDSKLPVVFWIYGGGFEVGSTQMYDGATLVKQSMSMKKDVVYVAVNYRVAG
jgi:acetylcholinesterase